MGAGRVGVALARALVDRGHSVGVIDRDADAFRRLPDDLEGLRVTGLGFDPESLVQAGIEDARAFAAVSSGDNSNIIAARVARERFGVRHVVARIYDPKRAEIYQRLGIATIATVPWAADQVLRRMLPAGVAIEHRDPSGETSLGEVDTHPAWTGESIRAVQRRTGARVAYLTRFGQGYVPFDDELLQEGDIVHVIAPTSALQAVQRALAVAPVTRED